MPATLRRVAAGASSAPVGYAAALLVPIAVTLAVSWLRLPAFVFEHSIILLVLGVAVAWRLRHAVVAAIVAVSADNVLLREPAGQPAITGYRDLVDLAMFVAVAIIISWLVSTAHEQRRAAREAERRERHARSERDRLIATVSHDLATPLSVLRGTVQFARTSGLKDRADFDRLLLRLEIATARATTLIRTLSDVKAVEADGPELSLAAHDLRELVSPVAQMMDRFSHHHAIDLTLPDEPLHVRCDPDWLRRVVENVLHNAVKYSPKGGPIEVALAPESGDAVLSVRDHGIGISPDALPRIFERSYRAPEAAAAAPGLGLGLSIAAHVVRAHGGTIGAAAAPGGGTVITLRLPLAEPGVRLAAAAPATRAAAR